MDSGTDSTATGGRLIDAWIYLFISVNEDRDSGTDSTGATGGHRRPEIYLNP